MALTRAILAAWLAAGAAPAVADVADVTDAASESAAVEVVAPTPLEMPEIPYPAGAPPRTEPVEVQARIWIDASGEVRTVEIVAGAGEPFDMAVMGGAAHFRFTPATVGGEPVEVVVPYTHTFVPPLPLAEVEAASDATLTAALEGVVVERGTRHAIAGAVVLIEIGLARFSATTDASGHFRILLPPGDASVRIAATGYKKFLSRESLSGDDHVKVKYLVDKDSYNPYETVIVGARERTEISRTTLRGREITRVPGTFGDPFRVVGMMPGVSQVMGLLPLPIVRGSSPGNTGFLLDGERVPLLFHLFGGPAVVHPEFIDRVDFYPGGFPVQYGGYTGGIVDGITRRARRDESRADIDLNLAQTGVFLRKGFEDLGFTATAAGRIGYPGVLISLVTPDAYLSYWDYQARIDAGPADAAWSVFVFGAQDNLEARDSDTDPLETVALFHFHRLDVRHHRGGDDSNASYRMVVGFDETAAGEPGGTGMSTLSWLVHPQARWHQKLAAGVDLDAGADGSFRDIFTDADTEGQAAGPPAELGGEAGKLWIGGGYTQLVWKPLEALMLIPGARGDIYRQDDVTKWSVDPRLLVRYRLRDDTWLKGVLGRYHQPPRLFIPLPGIEQSGLELGLLASTQVSVGAEYQVGPGVELDVQTYYNHMDPVLFDLTVNPSLADVQQSAPTTPPWEMPPPSPGQQALGDNAQGFYKAKKGRSYGVELLLRKRDAANVFGWISYTLSRSERLGAAGWAPFDFDRTHILNLVAGVHLPRNWELGGRLLFQTGTPLTTLHGFNLERTGPQFRVDVRIDKRAVWNEWLLDFYVDVVNVSVARESGGLVGSDAFRYVLPTVGFRAVL